MKIKSKKGIGEILIYIILIGLAVVVSLTVFTFQKQFVKDEGSRAVNAVDSKRVCDGAYINVKVLDDCVLKVTNVGAFVVDKIVIRLVSGNGDVKEMDVKLKPKEDSSLVHELDDYGELIEVIPVVKLSDDSEHLCVTQAVEVSCQ